MDTERTSERQSGDALAAASMLPNEPAGSSRVPPTPDRMRDIIIDELEPAWLRERVIQYLREHGAWWWKWPALITLSFVAVLAALIGAVGYIIHLAPAPWDFLVALVAMVLLAIAISAVLHLSEESPRRQAEAMLTHLWSVSDAPVLPLRSEYDLSRFPNLVEPSRIRGRTGLPNFWLPMRYVEHFRSINGAWPYEQIIVRLSREPRYASTWTRFMTRTLNVSAALAAMAMFPILAAVQANLVSLSFFGVGMLALLLKVRMQMRFADSVYAQRIKEDWPCLACGYPLKSLRHTEGTIAHCPECGSSLTTLDICLASRS